VDARDSRDILGLSYRAKRVGIPILEIPVYFTVSRIPIVGPLVGYLLAAGAATSFGIWPVTTRTRALSTEEAIG